MQRPTKESKDMILEGIFSSEVVDSSGEIVRLQGMDITTFENGEGTANVEHVGVHDGLGKETVGKVIYVKKIFKESDCEDSSQRYFYEQVRGKPFLYGQVRLFDGSGHHEAQDLAAQIRDYAAHDEPILVRFSIEGSTLTKEGNIIKESIARKVALTITPANKSCNTKLVTDPNAPDGFTVKKSEYLEDPSLRKIGGSIEISYNPILTERPLQKTLSAGSYDLAPNELTQGAALQKENVPPQRYSNTVLAALRDYKGVWDKKKFKEHLKETFSKAQLPEVSDAFLDHFTNIADDWKIKEIRKSEEVSKLPVSFLQLEYQAIELKKTVRNVLENKPNYELPKVYKIGVKRGEQIGPLGRVMVFNDQIHHLEDYHGALQVLLPEGPVTEATSLALGMLLMSPFLSVQEHVVDPNESGNGESSPQPEVPVAQEDPLPPRPGVFEYLRHGMEKPCVVEFTPNGAAIDGEALDPEDLKLLLENANNGIATIKWSTPMQNLAKRDATEDLMDLDTALHHVREGVKSGALHPSVERALIRHIYEDPMVEGVGNKRAANQFVTKNKPGVYASIDANDFKSINDTHGHQAGDSAIKALGGALRDAGQKQGMVKIFRPGGDEFMVHAPTHEDMSQFLRHATAHVDALPPINGTHKQSFSVGIGHTFGTADQALLEAKKGKFDPVSGQRIHQPGKTPHLGYSLYPGSEGHLFGKAITKTPQSPEAPPEGNKLP